MTSNEFRSLLATFSQNQNLVDDLEAAALLVALDAALDKFQDRPLADLTKKIEAIKAPAKRAAKKAATRKATPTQPADEGALIALVDEYKASLGDNALSTAVIAKANKLLKPGAVFVASAIGMTAKKETTKKAAIDFLKAKAAEAERDESTAERIRLGA